MSGPNFPENPPAGYEYEYAGIVYRFVVVPQTVGPDLGYWKANFEQEMPLNRDLLDLPRFPEGINYDPDGFHYRILKTDPNGVVKVSNYNFIMSPLGVLIAEDELADVGEYFIFGEDTIFMGSDADWQFTNFDVKEDVVTMKDFLKDCPNYTGNDQIHSWRPNNVETFESAFENATSFNGDIDEWATGSADNMDNMFKDATSFDQDISSWCVRLIPSRPTGFDIGSGIESEFDKQPGWGECPRNEDGGNFFGNVTIVGPDAVIVDTDENYDWTNDGNYQQGQYTTITEEWRLRGQVVTNPINFPAPPGDVELFLTLESPYATDSPVTVSKTVLIDATLTSLSIDGPIIAQTQTQQTYTVVEAGTGAGRVQYDWKVTQKGSDVPLTSVAVLDVSDDTRSVDIYFIKGGIAPNYLELDVVAIPRNGQDIEGRKEVLVEGDPGGTGPAIEIAGPDRVTYGDTETYELVLNPNITVLNITTNVTAPHIINHTEGENEAEVTFVGLLDDPETTARITFVVLTPTGTTELFKEITVGGVCVPGTVIELRTSSFTSNQNVFIGGMQDGSEYVGLQPPDWNPADNFNLDDFYNDCYIKRLIIDTDVYGTPPANNVNILDNWYSYGFPGVTVAVENYDEVPGGLEIIVEAGNTVTGGPGRGQLWNADSNRDVHWHPDVEGLEVGYTPCINMIDIPQNPGATAGNPGMLIATQSNSVTIQNDGTIQGGGGGGTIGGYGGKAVTVACQVAEGNCTRGSAGGEGGCGQGGADFGALGYDTDHYWTQYEARVDGFWRDYENQDPPPMPPTFNWCATTSENVSNSQMFGAVGATAGFGYRNYSTSMSYSIGNCGAMCGGWWNFIPAVGSEISRDSSSSSTTLTINWTDGTGGKVPWGAFGTCYFVAAGGSSSMRATYCVNANTPFTPETTPFTDGSTFNDPIPEQGQSGKGGSGGAGGAPGNPGRIGATGANGSDLVGNCNPTTGFPGSPDVGAGGDPILLTNVKNFNLIMGPDAKLVGNFNGGDEFTILTLELRAYLQRNKLTINEYLELSKRFTEEFRDHLNKIRFGGLILESPSK